MNAKFQAFARRYLLADIPPLSPAERLRSALGVFLGVAFCGLLSYTLPHGSHWLIAPVGASAVILFALTQTPLAQPWPLMGSYLAATASALACAAWLPWPPLAAAAATALTLWLMARLRCIHPPAGALALLLVLDGGLSTAPWSTALLVLGNLTLILLAGLLVNNWVLGRAYPYCRKPEAPHLHGTKDDSPLQRIGLTHEDLAGAMRKQGTFVDIQEGELVRIYNLAVDHAFDRHIGLSCGDIMARDIVTVQFGTELEEAWTQLRAHKIKALPVVDSFKRLLGIVTVADYLRQLDDTTAAGLAVRLQGLLKRSAGLTSEKAEVVGQIMTTKLYCASMDTPLSELVLHLSDLGLHHIPVLDGERRVVGVVTQSDVIAALYKHIALATA
jgi:CBS domain-containing membrane protein